MKVTRWKHLDLDEALILEGSLEYTKKCAEDVFNEDTHLLVGTEESMTREAYEALPEFQS